MTDEAVAEAIAGWRSKLVDLSRNNRLLSFRANLRTAVPFMDPSASEILGGIRAQQSYTVLGSIPDDAEQPVTPATHGPTLKSSRPHKEIPGVLRGLKRRADEQFLERGLSVLYLAFGVLHWQQADGTELRSPLLLVPVVLKGKGMQAPLEVAAGADEEVLNPALKLALEERGADLTLLPDPDDASLHDVVTGFTEMIERIYDFGPWSIEPTVHLAAFDFRKEAMYQDLHENLDRIVAHPVVRALATSNPLEQTDQFTFAPLSTDSIDETAPPEDTPLVLDADSSQRVAIAAGRAGRSFVMDGPPGTGKSQTIANMISTLMHDGKTVLFVSEKVAALDVVRKRLTEVGLGSFLFDIHSAKSSRKAVADELAYTLQNRAVPPASFDGVSRSALIARRKQLNAYAEAMNETRNPLRRSVHDVLGRLALLNGVPKAPDPELSTRELSDAELARILQATASLTRNWRPAREGADFRWRGVTTTRPLDREIDAATRELDAVERHVIPHQTALDALDFSTSFKDLFTFVESTNRIATVTDPDSLRAWLSFEDMMPLAEARAELERLHRESVRADASLLADTGRTRTDFPEPALAPPAPEPLDPARFNVSLEGQNAVGLERMSAEMQRQASDLERALNGVNDLANSWGLSEVTTFHQAETIRRVTELRDRETFPDARWFTAEGQKTARQAANDLERQNSALIATQASATRYFNESVFRAPLADLQHRFDTLHTGLLKHFSAGYKADKKTVEMLLNEATKVKDGINHLDEAIAWTTAVHQMEQTAAARAGILGGHWRGPQTDYRHVHAALDTASAIAALFSGKVPPGVVSYMTGTIPNQGPRAVAEQARLTFLQWVQRVSPAEGHPGQPDLIQRPIQDSISWLREFADHCSAAASRVRWVTDVTSQDLSPADAETVIDTVSAAHYAHRALVTKLDEQRPFLGSYLHDEAFDAAGLDAALGEANAIRRLHGGALTADAANALAATGPTRELEATLAAWVQSRDAFLGFFEEARRAELVADMSGTTSARDLLTGMRNDQLGMQEWVDFVQERDVLRASGLGAAFDFCCAHDPQGDQVPQIIEYSILRAWVEDLIDDDDRLSPLGAKQKDTLVAEYRQLDKDLVSLTAGRIITAANKRRPPNIGTGEPGLIRQQGSRKRKHMAVRDLIHQTRDAVLGLKPVFMMSPLAVSQYLPPDISFDVVIFDEASQVTPQDAINCIYRGRQLILAGDERQLPPTAFFERSVEVDSEDEESTEGLDDYESILELAKGSGAFPNLGLRWHYRSQHESLIAYSNYKFYGGNLITFPSSREFGETLGVGFQLVEDGIYERGGTRTNPREAQAVARRVIEHFQKTPKITLGVVTFSVAQEEAIDTAVRAELVHHPELERYFDGSDRLGGFFVRSLESVQGDERDVIFFSVAYGPDEAGKIGANFGPLNKKGGGRRLNVGITRARRSVVLFASMPGDRIPATTNENVELLRNYMDFAARGIEVLGIQSNPTGLDPESPFEDSVIQTIRAWGYEVEPQVGAAGYRVDIGVRHPERPGRFMLGVECDGYQYHSAPAARDRDRLRDSILTGLGWTMYRIWGTAWYRHREHEEQKLKSAIEAAVINPVAEDGLWPASGPVDEGERRSADFASTSSFAQEDQSNSPREADLLPTQAESRPVVESETVPFDETPPWVIEYLEASSVELPWDADPADPDSASVIAYALTELVRTEAPVHMNIVKERLRDWWSLGSIGSRIARNIEFAIRSHSPIRRDDEFLYLSELQVRGVRSPSYTTQRKVDEVHLDELALAVELTVKDSGSATRPETVRRVRSIFGWQRTGDLIAARLEKAMERAVQHGRVREDNGRLRIGRGEAA